MLIHMQDLEFRNMGEQPKRRMSLVLPTLVLVVIGLALLAIIVMSGTAGQPEVSIPTRLFPTT